MSTSNGLSTDAFSSSLHEKMELINPTVEDMELYEFRYSLLQR